MTKFIVSPDEVEPEERSKVLWATIIGYIHPTLAKILGYDPEHPEISDEPSNCIEGAANVPEKLTDEAIRTFADDIKISLIELRREKADAIIEEAYWFKAVGDDENDMDEIFIRELCRFKAQVESIADFENDMISFAEDVKGEIMQALTRIVETQDYDDGVTEEWQRGADEFNIICPRCRSKVLRKVTEEYVMDDKLIHFQCCVPTCRVKFVVSYGKPAPPEIEGEEGEKYENDPRFYGDDEVEHNIDRLIQHFADTMGHDPDRDIMTYEDLVAMAREQQWPDEALDAYESDLRVAWAKAVNERLENVT